MQNLVIYRDIDEFSLDIQISHNVDDSRYTVTDELHAGKEIMLPISILKGKSCGRAIISYLKSRGLSYSDIARIMNRDPRTVWTAFQRALDESYYEDDAVLIPVDIFSYRGLSILESVVLYLKSQKSMELMEIARSLGKNYQTIRTVYRRILKKIGHA